jgi:hypothetical protein
MTEPRDHTLAFLDAFYGRDLVYDFRAMHDRDRSQPAKIWRGTFAQCEAAMREVNESGPWGIHVVINEMDGVGLRRQNVSCCRAQLLDLDKPDAGQQLQRVLQSSTPPHMMVHTSAGRVQCWFKTTPHTNVELFEANQRRLYREYNGDEQFVDVTHTARLPGFYHHKREPQLVTVSAGPRWCGEPYDVVAIADAYRHIPVDTHKTGRQPLGHEPWQAPALDWLQYALSKIDPNMLGGRMGFIAATAAIKQAGWFLGEPTIRAIWDAWCAGFQSDKPITVYEYNKEWNSLDETSAGWPKLVSMSGIQGDLMAAGLSAHVQSSMSVAPAAQPVAAGVAGDAVQYVGDMLDPNEQAAYFQGCYWVTSVGKILGPNGRLMDSTKFNGAYGGKRFKLDLNGEKVTDEPWKAATRGLAWHAEKVDHMRFLPEKEFGHVDTDEFGLKGVNTYRKPIYAGKPGDVTPFLDHLARVLPVQRDRDILLAFMAQCIQRPGVKVKWAVVIQGVEGLGKTLFEYIMAAALGPSYVHVPAAKELTEGGGKFNGWMRNKLMIIINEVKSDEKRELVEVMKPWITDKRIEMQNKGQDQDMADNPTNWLMFTNHKDAIPISVNGRRYAIMYSALQSSSDLARLGMTDEYFSKLYDWAESGGIAHVVDYLMKYAVPADLDGKIGCTRAPRTSSTDEALAESRGWLETMILEAVERQDQGFRGGWVSSCAVSKLVKDNGQRLPVSRTLGMIFKSIGYYRIGLAPRVFQQEGSPYKATLYSVMEGADVSTFGTLQGYEPAAGGSSVVPMWPVPHAAE